MTLLSDENIHSYIEDYKNYQEIKKNAKSPFKQAVADLNRFTIIHYHGGVSIDITSILFNGLSWLD